MPNESRAADKSPTEELARIGITSPEFVAHWNQFVAEQGQHNFFNRPNYVSQGKRWSSFLEFGVPYPSQLYPEEMIFLKTVAVHLLNSPRSADRNLYRPTVARLAEATVYFIAALRTPTAMSMGGSNGIASREQIQLAMEAVLAIHLESDELESRQIWSDVRDILKTPSFLTSLRAKARREMRWDKVKRSIVVPAIYVMTAGMGRIFALFYRDGFAPHHNVIPLIDAWTERDCDALLIRLTVPNPKAAARD